jgi:hypothetical protein
MVPDDDQPIPKKCHHPNPKGLSTLLGQSRNAHREDLKKILVPNTLRTHDKTDANLWQFDDSIQ